jgi:predicted NBD/HSP70 family sugar kinase
MRLGIDIGGTKTAAVVVGDDGAPVALRQVPSGRGEGVVEVAVRTAREAVAEAGGRGVLSSVGACAPGVVDHELGVVRHAVNLGVVELALGDELAERLGHRVVVENDVKAAALGAFLTTGARPVGTFGYLNLGTGLAAAVLRDGRLDRGPEGLLGEIGHVPIGGERPCTCGQTGCLETVASGAALDAGLGAWRPGRPTLLDRAAAGDREAEAAADELVRGIRIALQLLVVAGGCERIVVGGGLTGLGEPLAERLRASIRDADRASRFHAALGLWPRTAFVHTQVPLAALGAAALPGFGSERDDVAAEVAHVNEPRSLL